MNRIAALALLALAGSSWGAPFIAANPIPVAGSGTYSFDGLDSSAFQHVFASGSNGVDSVSFGYNSSCPGAGTPSMGVSVLGSCAIAGPAAVLNGTIFSNIFSVQVANGTGLIRLYDSSFVLIASADLIGWVNPTSLTYTGPPTSPTLSGFGAFDILAVPEPATWLPLGLALVLGAIRMRRTRSGTRATRASATAFTDTPGSSSRSQHS
jgi:hypothetical protein